MTDIHLTDVTADNWRACADLEVTPEQRAFVAPVTRYLCLCHYGGVWRPLAVTAGGEVVGFVMWAVDPDDRSGWIGGLVIGREHQRRGYGSAAVRALVERLRRDEGCPAAALSYAADNAAARALYASLGFTETGEREDDELVARLRLREP
ncbi:MAG: GNAT family N-acetyltransferase [Deltaproteobacteria bacterium]